MFLATLLLTLATAAPAPVSLAFDDVETVDGRAVTTYLPLELGPEPVRPLSWEEPAPAGVRYGMARVGRSTDSALAVAWLPGASTLWLDADGDGRLESGERHSLKTGQSLALHVRIASGDGADPLPRTLLLRPGLLGQGPRWAVRGCMSGTLALGSRQCRTVLTDGDGDGCFDHAGADRVWIDLDGDDRFDPALERFPLGSPIALGAASYTIATDAGARAVTAHERDNRRGRLRLTLGGVRADPSIAEVSVDLVSKSGELVTVRALDRLEEVPVGIWRVASFELKMFDQSHRTWMYTFTGGRRYSLLVEPGKTSEASLLDGLVLEVSATALGGLHPGGAADVTPFLKLASGLFLSNCTTRPHGALQEKSRQAEIVLMTPDGGRVDQASSGFQ